MVLPLTATSILHPPRRTCQAQTCAPGRHLVALDPSRLNTYRVAHNLTGHNLKRENPQSRRSEGSLVGVWFGGNHSALPIPTAPRLTASALAVIALPCISSTRIYLAAADLLARPRVSPSRLGS